MTEMSRRKNSNNQLNDARNGLSGCGEACEKRVRYTDMTP